MNNIGRYTIVRKLATGGMAEVFLGRIDGLAEFHKRVVIKRILPQLANIPEFVEMFLKEARLAALLEHPNLVAVFDLGLEDEAYHLVMEFVEGTSLLALIHAAEARHELLPVDRAIWIVSQVLEGLSYAHALLDEQGQPLKLIHRDVSPENVLVSRSGGVKLADFGLAKAANHPRVTRTGAFKGKLHYLAPEMVHTNHFDHRVDLFSAGVLLYEAITNTKPFSGVMPNDILDSVLHSTPPPLAQLRPSAPPALQTVLDRALAKDPEHRYPNARAMQRDLDAILGDLHTRPGPVEMIQLLAHLEPPSTAKGNEPTQSPVVVEGGTLKRRSSLPPPGVGPPLPPSPFIPVSEVAPPRPSSSAGSSTVRGTPAFDPDASAPASDPTTRPGLPAASSWEKAVGSTQLEVPSVAQTQTDMQSPKGRTEEPKQDPTLVRRR